MRSYIFVVLAICSTQALAAVEDRITQPTVESHRATLRGQVHPLARVADDRGPVDPALALSYCTLLLLPAPGLEQFLSEQRNPRSPNYRRWLTPEQFADRFGASAHDIERLTVWLAAQGFRVNDVARGRHWITFSGTAAEASRAFRTEIHRVRVAGEDHFANVTDPSVPDAFAGVVSAIRGLHDFRMRSMLATPEANSGSTHYIAPDDFSVIYNVAPLYAQGIDGTGASIAVAGESDIVLSDIRKFRSAFGLPANDPEVHLVGPDPGTVSGAVQEADLDLEWSGAVARNARVVYVNSADAFTSAEYAIDQNMAPILTFSFGGCEAYESPAMRVIAQQANAQGITWFVSSGDAGAATCDYITATALQAAKGPIPSFPSSIPEVTSVGGTEFNESNSPGYWASDNDPNTRASALGYIPEMAWNDSVARNGFAASGGGPSVWYAKPAWQTGPGVPDDGARDTPDISLNASPRHYAYIVYSNGAEAHYGGTSASSPAMAGLAALLSQSLGGARLGNINPTLYRLAQATTDVFHDTTVGDNRIPCVQGSPGCADAGLGYAATPGYDLATGWGSVNAYNLITEWTSGTATTTTVTSSAASVAPADTVQLTATVTASGSAAAPTGSVSFLTSDTALGSAVLDGSGGSSVAVLAVTGNQIGAGDGSVRAIYDGDSVFTGSSASTTVGLTVPASSGSYVVPYVTPNPVPQSGYYWPYVVGLREKAGVATRVTQFTIDGVVQNLGYWSSTAIAPNGQVSASLAGSALNAPLNRRFVFTGTDTTGGTWRRDFQVPFQAATASIPVPGIKLTSAPDIVVRNPDAAPSCQWQQHLVLEETGGFLVRLTRFTAGSTDFSNSIQDFFGTTRLAPWGMLQADLCWSSLDPGPMTLTISGISELGTNVTATAGNSIVGPEDGRPGFAVSPVAVILSAGGATPVAVSFSSGNPSWKASLLPTNRTGSWLTISPASGSGPGQIVLTVSTEGLAKGAYQAMVAIETQDAIPEIIRVPVTLTVGASSAISIGGVANNASFATACAPGMQAAVFGSGLALSDSPKSATARPLPLTLGGVTATVNGIAAPLYYVSPTQINLQIPYEAGAGPAVLTVNNGDALAAFPFVISTTAPGIYQAVLNDVTGDVNTAKPGDVMTMYITGDGDVTPSLATGATPASGTTLASLPKARKPLSVTVGGLPVSMVASAAWFAGIPNGLVGVTQINFKIPSGVDPGTQPIVVTVGGVDSPPFNIQVTQ